MFAAVIERGAIAVLSNLRSDPIDLPSADWHGRNAQRDAIRRSGLRNVNHVEEQPDLRFLDTFERWLTLMRDATR